MQLVYTPVGKYRIHSLHDGAGKPVVLLHGLSGSLRWWRYTIPALAARFSVNVPELAGFGHSRPAMGGFTIDAVSKLVHEWLDARGLERVHLVGHSMGAQIAIHLASDAPQRIEKLVLVSASGVPRRLSPVTAARFVAELVPPRAWGAPTFIPRIAADALRAGPRTLVRATRGLLSDDVRPRLASITAPTLVLWGALDPLTPLADGKAISSAIPGARLIVLPDAAHNPMVDRPASFNQELISFLGD